MLPCESTVLRRLLLIERMRGILVRKIKGAERPEGSIGKVTSQTERIGSTFGIIDRSGPFLGKPCGTHDSAVATHRIDPGYLHSAESVVLQPLELIKDVIIAYLRSEPPPSCIWPALCIRFHFSPLYRST